MSEAPTTIGRYQVKRWLAAGAMGEVYEAYDPIIDRPVAIKMLRRELAQRADSTSWLERFRHEARAAGRRMHPNIVAILDFGEQDGAPFLAMEYVPGENVDAAIKRSGRFDETRALSIVSQVLSALEFAHAEGVIHRDIKPSNILLPERGPIKVADFGIAHLEQSDLTIDGDVLGTPSYMAPEQLLGGQVDHRSDLYSTGLVLFEMLTGEKAFKNRKIFDLARTMHERTPSDLWEKHPDFAPELTAIVNRALAFDANERYATAVEFAQAIATRGGAAERQFDATVVVPPPAGIAAPAPARPQPNPTVPPGEAATGTGRITLGGATQFSSFAPETLAAVERDLSTFIGPMARISVRRAAPGAADLVALYRELAKLIAGEADRAAFIAKSRDRARALPGGTVASSPSQSTGGMSLPGGTSLPGVASPATFPPDVLSRIEAGLAEHIGPIARVLIRQHMSRTSSVIDLCRELALFIPDEKDRASFLRNQRAT